ncbi:MAG: acyl-CoA reductase [Saprospiraceae bacterium]|nr:acyl-CoA reductase [Saprospiraceae bacterium]
MKNWQTIRFQALEYLQQIMLKKGEALQKEISGSAANNRWFTPKNYDQAIDQIAAKWLDKESLETWAGNYSFPDLAPQKNIGLVLAGNIPMVGFHDWLSAFVSGNNALIKLSDKDPYVLPFLVSQLEEAFPDLKGQSQFVERLTDYDATIATGSDNSARYFEYYFGSKPHIIRKNRNAIAVLSGAESGEELDGLAKDIFSYFGLGCRNVSKIYIPERFDISAFMEKMHEQKELVLHNKYKNNFDYNHTLFLMNKVDHYTNGCLLLLEDPSLTSRIATLHYEVYGSLEQLESELAQDQDKIQCVVSSLDLKSLPVISFGEAQNPGLTDYADGVDTVDFLNSL